MSLPEDNKLNPIETNEDSESTIFSAPVSHDDKAPEKSNLFKKLLAAFLALAIVIGGTLAVVKLIPEKEDINAAEDATIPILQIDTDNIEKVTLKNEAGDMQLISAVTETDGKSTVSWKIDGIVEAYTDSDSIKSVVQTTSKISALKAVEGTDAEFGLDAPGITYTLYPRNEAFKEVTVSVGNAAPAGLGYYLKTSESDTVYLVKENIATLGNVTSLDFATTEGVAGVVQTEKNKSCFTEGAITKFDYLTLSGKHYPNPLKIEMQNDEAINAYFAFLVTSPSKRIGNDENITTLINLLGSGVTSAGAYAFDPTSAQLEEMGFNNPDAVLTISVAGEAYTIAAVKVDDTYYAVIDSYGGLIHKIAASSLPFVSSSVTDFYSSFIVLENLSGLSNFKAAFSDGTSYDFVTEYTKDNESYKAFLNGKELDIDNFKKLYSNFIGLSPVEYASKEIKEVALTITLVHSEGTPDTVLTFKPYSSGRYQVEMNSIPMGLITTTNYEKLVSDIKNVANEISIK